MVVKSRPLDTDKIAPLLLNGLKLPFVKRILHLGHILTDTGTMEADCSAHWTNFCQRSSELKETLSELHPNEIFKSQNIYCTSWYGAEIWDYTSSYTNKILNAHKSTAKLLYDLPYNTHRFLTQQLRGDMSDQRVSLWWRLRKFVLNLLHSPSFEVEFLARLLLFDLRSFVSANIRHLDSETGLKTLYCNKVKFLEVMSAREVMSVEEADTLTMVVELLEMKMHQDYEDMLTVKEEELVDELINVFCAY